MLVMLNLLMIMPLSLKHLILDILLNMLKLLKCLRRKSLMHQLDPICHLRLLMHLMCGLTNLAKYLPNMLGPGTRVQRIVSGA
jgi:hypothetical protein